MDCDYGIFQRSPKDLNLPYLLRVCVGRKRRKKQFEDLPFVFSPSDQTSRLSKSLPPQILSAQAQIKDLKIRHLGDAGTNYCLLADGVEKIGKHVSGQFVVRTSRYN